MRSLLFFIVCFFCVQHIQAQNSEVDISVADTTQKIETAEVSCGECQFHLAGNGCDLAVRINKVAYYVDGTNINSHGDAHAKDGFCNTIRKAALQGKVVNNRFKVTYFKLLD